MLMTELFYRTCQGLNAIRVDFIKEPVQGEQALFKESFVDESLFKGFGKLVQIHNSDTSIGIDLNISQKVNYEKLISVLIQLIGYDVAVPAKKCSVTF